MSLSTLLRNGYLCDSVGASGPHGVRYLQLDCPVAQRRGSRIKYAKLVHEAGPQKFPGRFRLTVTEPAHLNQYVEIPLNPRRDDSPFSFS
jgi:hypothetical protein